MIFRYRDVKILWRAARPLSIQYFLNHLLTCDNGKTGNINTGILTRGVSVKLSTYQYRITHTCMIHNIATCSTTCSTWTLTYACNHSGLTTIHTHTNTHVCVCRNKHILQCPHTGLCTYHSMRGYNISIGNCLLLNYFIV